MKWRRLLSKMTIAWLLIIGIFLNLAYIGYMVFWPVKTVKFTTTTFPVMNERPIAAGSTLKYEVDLCRYTDAPAEVTRTLIGPQILTVVSDTFTTERGCRKTLNTSTVIPSDAPAGKYYLKIRSCYQVNPLRNICHDLRTEEFEVR